MNKSALPFWRWLLAGFLFVAIPGLDVAGINSWTVTGPEGGFALSVAFHPAMPGVAFTSAGSSIYRTSDYGQTWVAVREDVSNGAIRIAVDAAHPSRVLAMSFTTVYRSDDAGVTFGAVGAPPNSKNMQSMALAPDGSALFVGTIDGKVYRSPDAGLLWEERSTGLSANQPIMELAFDPQNPQTLYAIADFGGLYKTIDGGLHWTLLAAFTANRLVRIAVDPGLSTDLLLATGVALYSSHDGGASWSIERSGDYEWVGYHPSAPTSRVGAAVAIPTRGPVIHRAARNLPWSEGQALKVNGVAGAVYDPNNPDLTNSTLLIATSDGPLLTQDAGVTLAVRSHGIRAASASVLAAAHDAEGTIYAAFRTGPVGVYRRGASGWAPVNNAALRSIIPEPFEPFALAVDPGHGDTLFVSSGASVVRSLDGGATWSAPSAEFQNALKVPRSMVFDPSNTQVLYIGTDGSGVYRTENQGITWFPRSTGLPASIGALAVDPAAPGVVYAADLRPTAQPVLFKTTDDGASWAPASAGVAGSVMAVAVSPADSQVVYAAGIGTPQGAFRSDDGGQSWRHLDAAGTMPAPDIAVDPTVPTNVFVATTPAGLGVARSVDGGTMWENLDLILPGGPNTIRKLVLDPLRPNVVIAAVDNLGLAEFEVSPDLEVSLTSAPTSLPLDGTGSAVVRVVNHGPLAASAVDLTITLPAGVTVSAATPGQGTCAVSGAALHCALDVLRRDQHIDTAVSLVGGSAESSGTLIASVAGHESDPVSSNNSVSAPLPTTETADLGVTLTASTSTVSQGSPLALTATVTNGGPNASSGSQVVLQLGSGLTFQSASSSQGTCTSSGSSVTCTLGNLSAGAQTSITINTVASGAGALAPAAQVTGAGVDTISANNSATAAITGSSAGAPPGSGGGGALEWLTLSALLGAEMVRRAGRYIALAAADRCAAERSFGPHATRSAT